MKKGNKKDLKLNIVLVFIGTFLYILNNILIKNIKIENKTLYLFIDGYFNDLVCPLVLFGLINIILITKKNLQLTNLLVMIIICLVLGIAWELLSPYIKIYKDYITDYNDVFCYLFGTILYWVIMRINERR